jgi:hypothetical protein
MSIDLWQYQSMYIGQSRSRHLIPGMFDVLRRRIHSAMGTKVISFGDLERIELDSLDSICISDQTTQSAKSLRSSSNKSHSSSDGVLDISITSAAFIKKKVTRIIRSIKTLSKAGSTNEAKMSMLVFMDMIRDQEYMHVSMAALDQFIKICRIVPKAHYLHYYMFFLHYSIYYHHIRSTTDIIDSEMINYHKIHLHSVRLQSKYLQHIINESRSNPSNHV